jgi:uncharacterized protein with NRDE domain
VCLIALAVDAPGPWLLAMAANRDEFHDRPAVPAAWWEGTSQGVLAGRDLLAGGTWLGLRRGAGDSKLRIAALTNLRPGLMPPAPVLPNLQTPPSRGGLVAAFLCGSTTPAPFLENMVPLAGSYAGFNLLAIELPDSGKVVEAWYLNNLPGSRPRRLGGGVHVLSNAVLGVEWPKTRLLADAMTRVLEQHSDIASGSTATSEDADVRLGDALLEALADRRMAPDADLPDTGLDRSRERLLSAPFIVDDAYGTRCSTVLVVSRTGHVYFAERSFGPGARRTGSVAESFRR